jgi:hypothetical protein
VTRRLTLGAAAVGILATASLAAHEGSSARVTLAPGQPYVGASCRVVVVTTDASGAGRHGRRLYLVADMPMHVMRPVEVELRRTHDPSVYTGEIVFTMPGPWRVQLRVEDATETMTAAFEARVLLDGETAEPGAGDYALTLQDAPRPTLLPPEYVLGGAVALALLMQAIAIVLARGREVKMADGARVRVTREGGAGSGHAPRFGEDHLNRMT